MFLTLWKQPESTKQQVAQHQSPQQLPSQLKAAPIPKHEYQ